MAIQQSTTATAFNLTRYETAYRDRVMAERIYDQLATRINKTFEPRGSTIQVAWAAPLQPRPTTAQTGETSDFDPQTYTDVTNTFSLVWLADGLKAHELSKLKSSEDPYSLAGKLVGELAIGTIDALARRVATEGNLLWYGDGSGSAHTTRATMDLGTANDRFGVSAFQYVAALHQHFAISDSSFVIIDPWQYFDLLTTASTLITNRAAYTESGGKVLSDYEVGKIANFRIIVSPFAKAFYGAGANNSTADVDTTLNGAVAAGDKTCTLTTIGSLAANMWLTLGAPQTTTEADANIITEIVHVDGVSGSDVTFTGQGPGGGCKYPHANGATVENNDTVHCAVFGHKQSLVCEYDPQYGRYGKSVAPFEDGNAKQWTTWSFKYYGNYGRLDETQIIRNETSSSAQ